MMELRAFTARTMNHLPDICAILNSFLLKFVVLNRKLIFWGWIRMQMSCAWSFHAFGAGRADMGALRVASQ